MSSSQTTTDHDAIRAWAEARKGRPSVVRTEGKGGVQGKGGVLPFDFGEKEEAFEEVSWEEFFQIFDESKLALLYQDKTKDRDVSCFNKFVAQD